MYGTPPSRVRPMAETKAEQRTVIDVCTPSIGREGLIDLLRALDRCTVPKGIALRIVVVDDGPEGLVAERVASVDIRHPVRVVRSGKANIADARNAALDAAEGAWIAFVDDDCTPETDWLVRMHEGAGRADVVIGLVEGILPESADAELVESRPFDYDPGPTGTVMETGWSGNSFIRRATIQRLGLRFDPAHGRDGGEDTDFFARLVQAGGTIVSCREAVVYEHVPEHRCDTAYLRDRARRGGYDYAHALTAGSLPRRVRMLVRSLLKWGALALLSTALRPVSAARAALFRKKRWAAEGEVIALVGGWQTGPYAGERKQD